MIPPFHEKSIKGSIQTGISVYKLNQLKVVLYIKWSSRISTGTTKEKMCVVTDQFFLREVYRDRKIKTEILRWLENREFVSDLLHIWREYR